MVFRVALKPPLLQPQLGSLLNFIYSYCTKTLEAKYPNGGEQGARVLLKGFVWNAALLDVFEKTFSLASQRGVLVPLDSGANCKQRLKHDPTTLND